MKISHESMERAILPEISKRFKQYRIDYPITREDLAEKSMVSVGTIARFESGKDIGLQNFVKLLKALDLTENLDLMIPDPEVRPSSFVNNIPLRKRARIKPKPDTGWKWGDER